jgi:hypothetical protein
MLSEVPHISLSRASKVESGGGVSTSRLDLPDRTTPPTPRPSRWQKGGYRKCSVLSIGTSVADPRDVVVRMRSIDAALSELDAAMLEMPKFMLMVET